MSAMEWKCLAQFEGNGGDRVVLFALDDGHWGICWMYAPPHGPQFSSYDPDQGQATFDVTRRQYEGREGLAFDSRTEWQGGSV